MCEVRQMVEGHALERFMSGLGLSAESVLAQLNRYSEEGVRLTGQFFFSKRIRHVGPPLSSVACRSVREQVHAGDV